MGVKSVAQSSFLLKFAGVRASHLHFPCKDAEATQTGLPVNSHSHDEVTSEPENGNFSFLHSVCCVLSRILNKQVLQQSQTPPPAQRIKAIQTPPVSLGRCLGVVVVLVTNL